MLASYKPLNIDGSSVCADLHNLNLGTRKLSDILISKLRSISGIVFL